MKFIVIVACLGFYAMGFVSASNNTTFVPNNTDAPVLNQDYVIPKVLFDPRTNIIYYLESDGRHISAISPAGKLIWNHDPFVDAKLTPYRLPHPIIVGFNFIDPAWLKLHPKLGKADDLIAVSFNSSQFGALRKGNGAFTFWGQD